MSSERIVHIGFPKTATTFLQKEVFPTIEGTNFVDYRSCEAVFTDLIYLDDLDYDQKKVEEKLSKLYTQGFSLFSFEALGGAPFIYKGLGRSRIPKRLKDLGMTKVIITLRDQKTMYDSLYRQYVVQGGVMRFKDFLDTGKKWNLYVRAFNPDYLKYDRIIKVYFDLFGPENVLILNHELLTADKAQYLNILEKFIQMPLGDLQENKRVNKSLCNLSVAVLRIVNHFIFTSQKPNQLISNHISTRNVSRIFQAILDPYFFGFFSKRKSLLTKGDVTYIQNYYQESNENTKKLMTQSFRISTV